MQHFAVRHLGFAHTTREEIINNHTTVIASTLFGKGKLILLMDSTYIYIEKSNDHLLARLTYCVYKKRQLVKPMIMCTTTGYVVCVAGPYLTNGKNSDSDILLHMLEGELSKFLQPEDIIVADRGFQNAVESARRKAKFTLKIPV